MLLDRDIILQIGKGEFSPRAPDRIRSEDIDRRALAIADLERDRAGQIANINPVDHSAGRKQRRAAHEQRRRRGHPGHFRPADNIADLCGGSIDLDVLPGADGIERPSRIEGEVRIGSVDVRRRQRHCVNRCEITVVEAGIAVDVGHIGPAPAEGCFEPDIAVRRVPAQPARRTDGCPLDILPGIGFRADIIARNEDAWRGIRV